MNALAGLMNPAAIGQSMQQAFEQGQAKRRERDGNNALTAYALNPDDPAAFKGLAQFHPQVAMQVQGQRAEAQKKAALGRLRAAAAQGDPKAKAALWADDPDMAFKLDDRTADAAVKGFEFLGNAAYDIIQRPPEQRAALMDQYIDQAVAMGYPAMAQYKGRYSPELLNSFVAKVDGMKEFMTFQQPKYVPVGDRGLSGFQYGQPIEQGGQVQDFGAPAPAGVTFTPISDGGPTVPPSGTFRP